MSSITQSSSGGSSVELPGGNGNTPLANFGGSLSSAFQDALKLVSDRLPKSLAMPVRLRAGDEVEKLHLGFDTLEWSAEISDEELAGAMAELEYLAATSEPLDLEGIEVVVRRVGGFSHCYLISTSLGLSVWVPKNPMFRLRVIASPKYILSQDTADLEERAAILVASLVRL